MQPSIGNLLRELTRLYTQAQREHVTSGHDTSSTQSHVLMELGRAGLLTQQELGRRLSLDKGWVSRAVESLVQTGLVAKSRHDNDRRSRWLELTAKGRKRYQALNESLDAHAEQLMQPLSADQRQQIHQALTLLIGGMQGVDAEAAAAPVATVVAAVATADWAVEPVEEAPPMPAAEPISIDHEPVVELAEAAEDAIAQPELATIEAEAEVVLIAESSAEPQAAQQEAPPRPISPLADKVRPPMPVAHTRIVGSKTLPTRPLLSRTPPRTPLSRTSTPAEERHPEPVEKPRMPHPAMPPSINQEHGSRAAAPSTRPAVAAAAPPRSPARPVSAAPAQPVAQRPVAQRESPLPEDAPRSGSLFQKLLSQGSLFNKLLQREQQPEQEWIEQPAPVEAEPDDDIQFQPASPTDWNEIRNLLTANRLPVQGALNHLMHFVVATENGRVVGAIGMEVYGDIGLIRSLVVASNMRGKSVAKRLLRSLIERARAKQIGALYLLSGNTDSLFAAHGFEKMARADMPTKLYVSSELQGTSSSSTTALRLIL
ncbi:GNAT family N-acetyltransferase [Paludibacterium purpuratum]|uniref:DNA-binding MarR family transcriptional regulator n=1 Tax=Paludibacterium purpuratum TaxID=1144873 RepID=A0A4V3DUI1_9NEIS|nr:GNAT family N-acetyltransferase [Paludibacterium purpuratum]TDR73248.1 DNA-binding MarR family transcriptional regulator [Paludibacterium purpuratum]